MYIEWNNRYAFFDNPKQVVLSAINIGEIESLAFQLNWGILRRQRLQAVINQTRLLNIYEEVNYAYAEIDAFSQNKLPNRPLGASARNMGKNDIWLVATAHVGLECGTGRWRRCCGGFQKPKLGVQFLLL